MHIHTHIHTRTHAHTRTHTRPCSWQCFVLPPLCVCSSAAPPDGGCNAAAPFVQTLTKQMVQCSELQKLQVRLCTRVRRTREVPGMSGHAHGHRARPRAQGTPTGTGHAHGYQYQCVLDYLNLCARTRARHSTRTQMRAHPSAHAHCSHLRNLNLRPGRFFCARCSSPSAAAASNTCGEERAVRSREGVVVL